MLNFPTGNIQGRVDTLEKVVNYAHPDLLMIQELKTAQGLSDATDMMNTLGYGNFEHSTFVPQQSDAGNPYPLQQAFIYNEDVFTKKSQSEITTDVRDFNELVLYLNDAELANGADTTFIYAYVTHLKSSEGADNVALRLAMVNDWIAYMNANFTGDENVILAGDFNIYSNTEDAYEMLMSESNTVVMRDVFSSLGNWTGAGFAFKEILTQSTRLNQVAGDGAGGGLDDRFDFILFSDALMNDGNVVHYTDESFLSLGNNGTCYNESITDCSAGNDVPYDVLRAIYYMSDHIPQVCELTTTITLTTNEIAESFFSSRMVYSDHNISAHIHAKQGAQGVWSIHNTSGQLVAEQKLNLAKGNNIVSLNTSVLESGLYFFVFTSEAGMQTAARFVAMK